MGGSDYARAVYQAPCVSSGRTNAYSAAASAALTQRGLHADLDPRQRRLVCTAHSPVVVAIDVTGSMGSWTRIIYDKLPLFYGQLKLQGYLEDPSISFAAMGDCYSDKGPLQVCPFAQGLALDNLVQKIWLEGNGGVGFTESYELAAAYYASHVTFTNACSKPFFFFTGDEACYDEIRHPEQLRWIDTDAWEGGAAEAFDKLKAKYHVFFLKKRYHDTASDVKIMKQWVRLLGSDRVLMLKDPKACVDVMLGVIAVITEQRGVNEYVMDLVERGQTEERQNHVREILSQVERTITLKEGVLDVNGRRHRRCAVSVVFNSRGEVLLGESIDRVGSWQMPEGVLDRNETLPEAATRQLHEEVGLSTAEGLLFVEELPENQCCCHQAGGWLTVLVFSLFFLPGAEDTATLTSLGERVEFSSFRWVPLAEAVDGVLAPKKPAYQYLLSTGGARIAQFLEELRA
mmetsp:Transcript_32440/g.87092  ORF Transcript_32440/g.87092 Transcript_32440/m.87092 type:complete len:459 (-) Transcript_32440:138-1514(-)